MRIISHDSSLLENYFFWLVKFSKIRQTFFAKYPNILIEQHLSISLIFTTIISSHHPLSIIVLQTNTQRYVKSRDIECCSLSREGTSPQNLKWFFFFTFPGRMRGTRGRRYTVVVSGRFLCRRVPPKKRRKRQERWYQRNEFTVGGMKGNGIKEREGREGEEERKVLLQRRPRDITVGRIHYASQRLVFALFLRFDSLGLSLYRPIGL